jgi:TetR/AcrR family transcriptional regulator, transcriptional repressor for nem operon
MLSKADRTKELIVQKAAHLFNTKGYHGTSMGDILAATGLAKGGVYGNFSSKEEIAVLAFEYAYQTVINQIRMKTQAKKSKLDKLLAIIDYYRNYSIEPPIEGGCPILNASCDVDDTQPALRERVAEAVREMLHSLTHLIRSGQEKGEFRAELDPAETAELIYSQIEGGVMLARITNQPQKLNRILDYLKLYVNTQLKA